MEQGDEWVYRVRDDAPSERVRIVEIHRRKQSFRVDIEFIDGEKAGQRENVPGKRLRAPWVSVQQYDQLMSDWARLRACTITDAEDGAIETVFRLLIPTETAVLEWDPVDRATTVTDPAALEKLIGRPIDNVRAECESFELDGTCVLSPLGSLRISEWACQVNPMRVLDWVLEEEKEARHRSKYGHTDRGRGGAEDSVVSAEQDHSFYLGYQRPEHELLRQWCGHRAITLQERLLAAEAEVHRLDILLASVIKHLKAGGDTPFAESVLREHVDDQITPTNIRPVVERPLSWWDVPPPPQPRFRGRWF